MNFELPVKASWFYKLKKEKVKFNWFCYEYACVYYEILVENMDKQIKKWVSARTKEQVAEFCAYFAKRMKQGVVDRLAGKTDATELDEEYISDYCHKSVHSEDVALLLAASRAWDEHTLVCITCPTRCISERDAPCEFFDRMERGGYFS
jgi:deoxycytidylate deaminase